MRIALFGNCQVVGLADCLHALNPHIEARPFLIKDAGSDEAVAQAIWKQVSDYDLLLTHHSNDPRFQAPPAIGVPSEVVPKLFFTGFHPDQALVPGLRNAGMINYHSTITAAAYLLNVPHERVPTLFNSFVFSRLGYFDEAARSKSFLIDQIAETTSFDAGGLFNRCARLGRFMHTPNHPTIAALWEIARSVCDRHSVSVDLQGPLPNDRLAGVVRLPVYPEIAKRLGVEGSRDTIIKGNSYSTEAMVALAYEHYANRKGSTEALQGHESIAQAADLLRPLLTLTS